MKIKKIGAALALSGFLALSCNSIFAMALNIENIGENKYVGYGGMNQNHSNYAYYLSIVEQVYCDYPGEIVRNGYEYNWVRSETNPLYYYAMTLDEDTQLKQAALWRFSGGDVQSQFGSLEELDSYCSYVQSKANEYNNQTTTITNISRILHYRSFDKAYVSDSFNVGMGYKISLYEQGTSGAYFEKNGQNIGKNISDSAGEYRIVLPVDAIGSSIITIRTTITEKDDIGAAIYVSDQTSQRMIKPYRKTRNNYNINFSITFLKGDMNSDTYVNSTDAAIVLDIYKNNNATEEDILRGDMNQDNMLNSIDASMILDVFKNS